MRAVFFANSTTRLQEVSILAGITGTLESVITHYNTFTMYKDVMTWGEKVKKAEQKR